MMCIMSNTPCQAESDLNEIKTSVTQIKDALLGTEFNQQQGLIFQVKENERKIKEVERQADEKISELRKNYLKAEKRLYYWSGFFAAAGLITGVLIKKLIEVI